MKTSVLAFIAALFGSNPDAAPAKKKPDAPAIQPAPSAAPRLELKAVVERMQKRYDEAKDFRAGFTQRYVHQAFGKTRVSSGQIQFKKPGKMRWDYEKPERQMFLSNGRDLWLYQPEDAQAFKQDLKTSQLPAALAFLMGKGRLVDEFEIAPAPDVKYGKPDDYRLSLKPKEPQSSYKSIHFVVDAREFLVVQTVLVDAQGNVNDITFHDVKVNTKIPDATFNWSPPPKTRVIDTAKLEKAEKPPGK